jgi:hypothetical protein
MATLRVKNTVYKDVPVVSLQKYNDLYSSWEQAISENQEFERFLNALLTTREQVGDDPYPFALCVEMDLEEFRRRMKPVRAMRKARPK